MFNRSIWMGSINQPYINEAFIERAFHLSGYQIQRCRIPKNKYGSPQKYCFIDFNNELDAFTALHKLNGKQIPETNIYYRLKRVKNPDDINDNDLQTLFVTDIPLQMDDWRVFEIFRDKYRSTLNAEIIYDDRGTSKGFGFVRIADTSEFNKALDRGRIRYDKNSCMQISRAIPRKTDFIANMYTANTYEEYLLQCSKYQNYLNSNNLNDYYQTNECVSFNVDVNCEIDGYINDNNEFISALASSRWLQLDDYCHY